MKRIGALALLASVALAATPAAADQVIEHWMRTGSGYDQFHHDAIPSFEAAHPGVKIDYVSLATKDSEEKFLLAVSNGLQVDVIRTNPEVNLRLYAENGLLLPLNDLVKAAGIDLSVYDPQALKIMTFDGKLYGIPYTIVPYPGLFYRTDSFDDAGLAYPDESWTWQGAFTVAAKKLAQRDATGQVTRWGASVGAADIAYSWGAGPLSEDKTASGALSPTNVDFMNFVRDLWFDSGVIGGGTNEFINGQSPMLTGGYWQKASMVKKHLESFAVAPAPSGPAGRVLKWVVGAYSIPKASADPVLALQWVGHLTSVPWATEWVKRGLNPAGRMDVNRMAQFQADPVHKAWSSFFDDQAAVLNWPPNLRYDEVNKAWQAAIDRVAKGQMAPQASLQQLDHDVKVILAEPKLTVALP